MPSRTRPSARTSGTRSRQPPDARLRPAHRPQPPLPTGPGMTEPKTLIELRSVSKSYGETNVLETLSLEVRDGEFITLLGPSGSGKTTILRLIGGFTTPTSGEILLDGRDIAAMPINKR